MPELGVQSGMEQIGLQSLAEIYEKSRAAEFGLSPENFADIV